MENKKQLPLRMGVGIILLNHENNVFSHTKIMVMVIYLSLVYIIKGFGIN